MNLSFKWCDRSQLSINSAASGQVGTDSSENGSAGAIGQTGISMGARDRSDVGSIRTGKSLYIVPSTAGYRSTTRYLPSHPKERLRRIVIKIRLAGTALKLNC
jgi:hypothetical protein